LSGDGGKLLDEVVRAMREAPESRVLVTGYADRSGDAAFNLALSERRAKAVRSYLLDHGIGAERVLLNYYGASRSTGEDAAERRVELEWTR
jgi:outer membrane protein OmpA-like peptidoglycan-associated protein